MFESICVVVALTVGSTNAEWIVEQGGHFERNDLGDVIGIDLSASWITDVDLLRVAAFEHVEWLDLSHTRITSRGLDRLRGLRNVRRLRLQHVRAVTDSGLEHLADWKQLRQLDLQGTRISSRSLSIIGQWVNLKSLDVSLTTITDQGFEDLVSLVHLQKLAIGGNRITGSCLRFLSLLPSLTDLDVGGMQRVDSGLWGVSLDDDNLRQIGMLRSLRTLRLNGANVNDRGADRPGSPDAVRKQLSDLTPLCRLENLEVLDLSCTPISSFRLKPLIQLPKLRELRLGETHNLDDESLTLLRQMPALETVYAGSSRIEREATNEFSGASRGLEH